MELSWLQSRRKSSGVSNGRARKFNTPDACAIRPRLRGFYRGTLSNDTSMTAPMVQFSQTRGCQPRVLSVEFANTVFISPVRLPFGASSWISPLLRMP